MTKVLTINEIKTVYFDNDGELSYEIEGEEFGEMLTGKGKFQIDAGGETAYVEVIEDSIILAVKKGKDPKWDRFQDEDAEIEFALVVPGDVKIKPYRKAETVPVKYRKPEGWV